MQVIVSRKVEIPLQAMEKYAKRVFSLTVNLAEMFNFSAIPELLNSVQWTKVLPVFIPAKLDNRQAVKSLVTAGQKKPYEKFDVMKYKGSEGVDKPQLFLIEDSHRPNLVGVSADDLVKTDKLRLPLKGYAIAQGLHHYLTDEYLDSETCTWFPGETLPGGKSACGDCWYPNPGCVRFNWGNSDYKNDDHGARLAIPVPLNLQP